MDILLDSLPSLGLVQMVKKTTRHCQSQISSLIDYMWVSNRLKHVKTRNITTDSDHDLISITLKTNGNVNWQEPKIRRFYREFDRKEYFME